MRIHSIDSLRKADRPSGSGWHPIPGGKKGGYRRMRGGRYEYWYPSAKPKKKSPRQLDLFGGGGEKKPEPKPKKPLNPLELFLQKEKQKKEDPEAYQREQERFAAEERERLAKLRAKGPPTKEQAAEFARVLADAQKVGLYPNSSPSTVQDLTSGEVDGVLTKMRAATAEAAKLAEIKAEKKRKRDAAKAKKERAKAKNDASLTMLEESDVEGPWGHVYDERTGSKDMTRTFRRLAEKHDGRWQSEKQARFVQARILTPGEDHHAFADAWARKLGIDGTIATAVTADRIKQFGSKTASLRRYTGHIFVVDSGGVVAIGKPKFDTDGNPRLDRPVETLFRRTKKPEIVVDLAAEKRAARERNKGLIEKIEKLIPNESPDPDTASYEELEEYDRKWGILESFLSQLQRGRDLSIKQRAILARYDSDLAGDHKAEAKKAQAGYSKVMGRVLEAVIARLKTADDPRDREHAPQVEEALKLLREGKYSDDEVGRLYEEGKHGADYWLRQAHYQLAEEVKQPPMGEPSDAVTQLAKMQRAKKLTKKGARFIALASRIGQMNDAQIEKVTNEISSYLGEPPPDDPFAEFEKAELLPMFHVPLSKGGPFIGPKGGLYADPAHKIPWNRKKHGRVMPGSCPRCKGVAHVISRQTTIGEGDVVSSAPCRTCNPKGKHPLNEDRAKKLGLPIPKKRAKKPPSEPEQPAQAHQMSIPFHKPQQQSLFRSYSVEAYPIDGYLEMQGLRVAVETGKGSKRRWFNYEDQEHGETVMVYPYGFLIGADGYDGDELDVYVGPDRSSDQVFVINQRQMGDKRRFDEHKVMLGFRSEEEAKRAYLRHYDEHGPQMLGSCRVMSMDAFKKWVGRGAPTRGPA